MEPFGQFGRMLILFGALLVVLGVVLTLAPRIPFLGNLPGDLHLRGKNWSFHFPIVTSIVVSVVLTVLLNLFFRK
ncbi:MAG: DUF2905 domain-containing protein [Candidatus Tectomicrobia bacterium]|nr:DUF2905 domain-containing protein [Candidatus Tectomicrobia bacterium]MBI2177036.1 DUF2905 domain-containing protein [Candidatus Tectomicrobia bacterium]MBI3024605.1 DUF2905 domain-containing protein [Candidatus Tectomicrobia bacterium]